MDINRPRNKQNAPAIDEFRNTIKEFLQSKNLLNEQSKLTKNYLHLAIHGMRDDRETVFEIGTRNGNSCSPEIQNWFVTELKSLTKNIGVNSIFPGDFSKSFHRDGDPNSGYEGYGNKFHTIQIEINQTWRRTRQNEIVKFLSQIMGEFDDKFNKK